MASWTFSDSSRLRLGFFRRARQTSGRSHDEKLHGFSTSLAANHGQSHARFHNHLGPMTFVCVRPMSASAPPKLRSHCSHWTRQGPSARSAVTSHPVEFTDEESTSFANDVICAWACIVLAHAL
jgi:hypothetical protein